MLEFITQLNGNKEHPPGRLLDVGGIKLHLHCSGPVNDYPTVVIEGGCGQSTEVYSWLQEILSQRVQVCTYDRAGLGWSQKSNQPRNAASMTTELHALLEKAGLKGPYIMVGHSLAGLIMRVFTAKYSQKVAGIVFLDASHPQQYQLLDAKPIDRRTRILYKATRAAAFLGLTRFYNPVFRIKHSALQFLPSKAKRQLLHLSHQSKIYTASLSEMEQFSESAAQASKTGNLGDLPVVVITGPNTGNIPNKTGKEKFSAIWMELQRDLAKLSSRGKHRVIEGAGHMTLVSDRDYAAQVADEIFSLIFCNVEP